MLNLVLAASLAHAPVARLTFDVREYGIRGSAVVMIDRRNGRYVRRILAGPASSAEGYDGHSAWIADAANNAYIQGNADTRAEVMRWSQLWHGFVNGEQTKTVRIRVGSDTEDVVFSASTIRITTQEGTTQLHLVAVQNLTDADQSTFAPPAPPNGAEIDDASGIATVPMLSMRINGRRIPLVVVPVSIDGAPPMRFVLDTGGQNILTPLAAKRLHLTAVGGARVGGAGSGMLANSYAWVSAVGIGAAHLRHQPFMIVQLDMLPGIDGIVGAELLSRLAARFDFAGSKLLLARHVPQSWFAHGNESQIAFNLNMPDIAGSIDGSPGRFTLDTGSAGPIDVNAPFAQQYGLYKRYHAVSNAHFSGVGGSVHAAKISLDKVTLGNLAMRDIPARLTLDPGGVSGDPTTAGNVGERIFRNYTLTIDYSTRRIDFEALPTGLIRNDE